MNDIELGEAVVSEVARLEEQSPVLDEQGIAKTGVADVRELIVRRDLIINAIGGVMKVNHHFGTIPGTDQPPLLPPGAQVISQIFRLGADPDIEDLSGKSGFRFAVRCRIFHIPTGLTLGYGVGEASTNEDKYKWRRAVSEVEYDHNYNLDPDTVRIKFYRPKGNWDGQTQQILVNPADQANTVRKMAKKRAYVDGILMVTAAGDLFEQGEDTFVKDIPPKETKTNDKKASKITEGAKRILNTKMRDKLITQEELFTKLEITSMDELDTHSINVALKWIDEHE